MIERKMIDKELWNVLRTSDTEEFEGEPEEFLSLIMHKAQEYREKGYQDLKLRVVYDWEGPELLMYGSKPESDKAFEARKKKAEAAAKRREEKRLKEEAKKRKLYEKLKKEFEDD